MEILDLKKKKKRNSGSHIYRLESDMIYLGSMVKDPPVCAGDERDPGWSLGQEDPLEQEMATHRSILAWKFPWTEEPGRLQSMGLQKV